ncbi:hypothetical protein P9Y72_13915, partial [Bacillus cereus]|nr:hypothetical protein [Bacillus cereus]
MLIGRCGDFIKKILDRFLANSNNANIGDPILQPGPIDGGSDPADRIATLSRFIPITFSSQVPLENQ